MTGVIIKSTGSWYWVRTEEHQQFQCRIRGKFRTKGIKSTNPLTVGDHVDFILEENSNTGIITRIHDRKNYIVRKSVNLSKQTHIIAANIDLAFLLITLDNPPTFPAFIDRFLATAEAYDIEAVLLFNKMDLLEGELEEKKNKLIKIYRDIGYTCIEISVLEKTNVELVKNLMLGKTSMFSGHSGVGKSSLINVIDPGLSLKTAEISAQHKQGQHTTTFAEMFPLPTEPESYIIDTPGIKGFGVVDFEKNEISDFFPEFFALKQQCKFNNCLHVNEPKCAVKEALNNGGIAKSRYRSYLQMLEGEEESYRTNSYDI
ncbi:ribosome small subunit-dependent GTPase A [Lutimonas zeaxanthinifaciens]|uniref:ribosome small subunit-dependent GTPase A n=1 Tax=Lutimonas zeaxanthinifaciens TaxID=3060215 RepID=UPI00265D28B8|nr:ribosome small subunit-dependent GTPase A [Lutimonas sp. YSD2104]WKK65477.1 ribosome small subunit-dependent GTPase A [Lutimonas sp. YSD2104]